MMRPRLSMATVLLVAAVALAPAHAAVVASGADGFTSEGSLTIAKPPAAVWASLVQWGRWWSPAHSYSGVAGNFVLVPRATGTLVEAWGEQSVRHAVVLTAMPGKLLRLQGGFGPLQALPVAAILDFKLAAEEQGTRITLTYRVAGPAAANLPALAGPVDSVMSEAMARLGRFAATGQP